MNFLNTPIKDLSMTVRAYNCLKRAGIYTVEDMMKLTEEDLLNIKNLGKIAAREIVRISKALVYIYS